MKTRHPRNNKQKKRRQPDPYENTYQYLRGLWRDWLGQLTFIAVILCALGLWPIPTLIFIGILLIGMFHRRVFAILTEIIGQINDLFLGTPVGGGGNARHGGIVPGLFNVAARLWGWVSKPFQPQPREIPPVTEMGPRAARLHRFANFIDGRPNGFRHRWAESLRHRAGCAAADYQEKKERIRQKELEDTAKGQLGWTHLIGAILLTCATVVFVVAELSIGTQTILGMMGKEFEGELFEHPIFSSFELMTGLAIVCMGIVFGIYLLDLWGFVPLIPVHLFGFKKQRLLIWMVAFCLIGTIVVTGALGIFRYFAITQPAEIIESSRTGDISSPFDIDGGNTIPPDFEASIEPTTEMSVVEKIAVAISLVGIPVLALVGVALSFNGVAVLAMFLILGGIATVSGGVALLAVFARLFHHLLVFIFSVIYVLFNALTGMTGMIAAPFVQAFCLRGTDPPPDAGQGNAPDPPQGHYPPPQQPLQPEHTTEAGQQDSDPNATDTESSETSRRSDENQQPFTPSDRDWNPLE